WREAYADRARPGKRALCRFAVRILLLLARAEASEDFGAARHGVALDALVRRAAVRIHGHQQRAEAPDAEAPDAFRVEVVHVDLFDRLDPGGLQRRGAADHREIDAADVAEGI